VRNLFPPPSARGSGHRGSSRRQTIGVFIWMTAAVIVLFAFVTLLLRAGPIYTFALSGQTGSAIATPYEFANLLLSALAVVTSTTIAWLMYRLSNALAVQTAREATTRIRQSAYHIYHTLTYALESTLRTEVEANPSPVDSVSIRDDFIRNIANLSQVLPGETVKYLYSIFVILSQVPTGDGAGARQGLLNAVFSGPHDNLRLETYPQAYSDSFAYAMQELEAIIAGVEND